MAMRVPVATAGLCMMTRSNLVLKLLSPHLGRCTLRCDCTSVQAELNSTEAPEDEPLSVAKITLQASTWRATFSGGGEGAPKDHTPIER